MGMGMGMITSELAHLHNRATGRKVVRKRCLRMAAVIKGVRVDDTAG